MMNERKLRKALKAIAAITLWGEKMKSPFWKQQAIESGEYEAEGDYYAPTSDTVASYLQFAVETARDALRKQ